MQTIKNIGAGIIGLLIFVGVIAGFVLVFAYGPRVAIKADPILAWISVILLAVNILSLPLVFFKKTRAWYGLELFISSLIYGLSLWVLGFLVTYLLWGLGAVILGIFILGFGVVPFGLVASAMHHEWSYFWNLIFMLVLTFGARIIGSILIEKAESEDNNIIEAETEEKPSTHSLLSKLALLLVGIIPVLYIIGVIIDRRSNEHYYHPSLMAEHFLLYPADALLILLIGLSIYLLITRRKAKKQAALLVSNHKSLDTGEKNEIKNKLNTIKNTGQNTEIIGWLLLAVGAGVIWLQSYDGPQAVGVWIFYLIVGLYLIYSGKYIRYARGKHIAGFLLFNGFLLLLLTPGILPLIVSIQSFINYGRYRKLKSKLKPKFTKHQSLHISTIQAIVFTVLIAAGIVSLVFKFRSSTTANTSSQQNNSSISQQSSLYTATNNFFTINFPGRPTVSNSSSQVSGYTVPITTYDSQVNNDSQEYDVYAYSWPSQGFDFTNLSNSDMQSALQTSSTNLVQAIKGNVTNSNSSNHQGHPSIDTQFTTQISGNTYTGYLRVFFVGNNEYGLLALGSSQDDFNNFANSFNYTGQ
ncbi:MAG TPA: hypothetical protein VGS08_01020 [Candidatus Saccharimonadales bacterium]|nr:hypothetical protein [Candidatus Saccharimonadales bacterium]